MIERQKPPTAMELAFSRAFREKSVSEGRQAAQRLQRARKDLEAKLAAVQARDGSIR